MATRLNGLGKLLRDMDGEPVFAQDVLGQQILNKEGEPRKLTAKSLLTMVLGRGQAEDPIRAIDVGLKIHAANEHVTLDDADIKLLVTTVKTDRGTTNLAKAFLLRLLEEAKPMEEKQPKEKLGK